MSPLPSTTESWDSDPDLVLPDGPLTLLNSDTEGEAETSSSSVSVLFSNNGNHSAYSVGIDEDFNSTDDCQNQKKLLKSHPSASSSSSPQSQSSQHEYQHSQKPTKHAHASRRAENRKSARKHDSDEEFEIDQDDDRKGGTLTLKSAKLLFLFIQPSYMKPLLPGTTNSSTHASRVATLASQSSKSTLQCSTVNEEDDDLGNDFELPPSGQSIHLTDLTKKSRDSNSKPNSTVSLTGSEFDGLDDDSFDPPKSSASSRRDGVLMTTLSHGSANSISHSTGNRAFTDDSTPRIRTRPSLTPSLMSDRSSSSFPEVEDDINEGFFDDIEFPPEFGIPNNLAPAPTSTTPGSTHSTTTPKPGQSSFPDPKGKQTSQGRSIDLQNYLNSKVKARALLVERNTPSYLAQQVRQNISTFEDPDDERVEDGLEIETGSIHPAKLHNRKSSSLSSASSHPHQSGRNSYFQQSHGQKSKPPRVTVPFPSATSATSTSQASDRHAPAPSHRSSLNQKFDNRPTPVPSSSTSAIPGRPASHASLINRPNSVVPPGTSNPRLHALTPHRPISAAGIASGLKNAAYSSFVNPPSSESLPRFRTKSLRPSVSNAEISNNPPPALCNSGPATSSRVQSPLGNPSRAARLVSRASAASSLRDRVSTLAVCNGPPVLSASSQRTLKHKKSAAALKSLNLSSSGPQSSSSSASDGRAPLSSPPGSNSLSNARALHRKQSMPSLNREGHHSSSSAGLPTRLGGGAQSAMNAAAIWKSSAIPQTQVRHQPYDDCSSMPSSPNLVSGSALPSYADPTRASINRHIGTSGGTSGLPDRSTSANSRRSSTESARLNACSPAPPTAISTPGGSSRLTMPTIASRLKAKPSIIHEEHSSTSRRWTTNGTPAVVPHQLRRPRRPRTYGDGTELDEFDDLPTSKEKEKLYTRAVKNSPSTIKNPSKLGSSAHSNPVERRDFSNHSTVASQRSRSRLETRKAEGVRRRTLAINAHIKKISTKKGLIRQMSGNALSQLSTNTDMRWNDQEARWEGNEHILREFDNVLSTSSRPALISQYSIQSPRMKSPTGVMREDMPEAGTMSSFKANKAQNHVVGGMIFDAESMSWRKLGGGEEDEDELRLESDEELEQRWLADDESSSRPKPMGGIRTDGWNSLSSSLSLPTQSQHKCESEESNCQSSGTRTRGRQSGSFWLSCVEAEKRHKKEIISWIPIDDHQQPEPTKPVKKSSHPVKPKKSNISNISGHTPSSTTSVYPSSLSHKKSAALTNMKPFSVIPGNHSHAVQSHIFAQAVIHGPEPADPPKKLPLRFLYI
ncbi:hypothetical protein VP01_565g2 [Puccinia sorghi]|uniref:Uncharacterized protein n=1 Tax=Puccinia sorghi TaxID=27349 RepID=A0A0L6UIU8_9BASI|nr:hypothetical protein VP01_565g2 [Puccinia sorghi]